jgi:hypothetical protein
MHSPISPLWFLALLSLPLGACSGSPEPTASRAAAVAELRRAATPARTIDLDGDAALGETDPASATEFFVWTREDEERTLTYRIDASGRMIEALDGVIIATGTGNWRWRVDDRSVPTIACEHYDDEGHVFAGEPVEPGTATRASLEHLASGAEQIIVDPGVDLMGNAEVQHDVGIIASIGPYIFAEESTYAYTCGAHGNTGVAMMIWNAATGTTVAMPTDLGPLDAARRIAIAELTESDDDAFAATEDNLELTEVLPRFAPDGGVLLGLQFTAPTCYACTRGGFSSYTKSTVVEGGTLPALLAPFARPPSAVRTFLRTHPDIEMKGWSAR